MKMERAIRGFLGAEDRGNGARVVSGYAAVFYDEQDPGTEYKVPGMAERIAPTAFDRVLRSREDVVALFNHDPNQVLGRRSSGTLKLSVDTRGLRYEVDANTRLGEEVWELVRRGDLAGSSFAFTVKDDEITGKGRNLVRTIKSVELYDVGPVTYPAYEATQVQAASDYLCYVASIKRRNQFLIDAAAKTL